MLVVHFHFNSDCSFYVRCNAYGIPDAWSVRVQVYHTSRALMFLNHLYHGDWANSRDNNLLSLAVVVPESL